MSERLIWSDISVQTGYVALLILEIEQGGMIGSFAPNHPAFQQCRLRRKCLLDRANQLRRIWLHTTAITR